MSERVVPKTSEGNRPAYRITCHECGCSDAVTAANNAASLPPEMIRKKFQQRGWIFGGSPRGDTCPGCRLKRAPPRSLVLKLAGSNESLPVGVIEMPKDTVVPIKADPPREMSRDDRRIIFGKLEGVYLDEKRGYDEGWTDDRLAKDLGVPRAWVAKVRDENFGPVVTVDVEALKAENEALWSIVCDLYRSVNAYSINIRDLSEDATKVTSLFTGISEQLKKRLAIKSGKAA